MRFSVQWNNAPLCPNTAHLFFHHISVILIPSKVSLSKTVTQSLPHSPSLSICQSAMSHSLIQSVPHFLSLSVSRSFSHCIPLSLFAHLTSPSLTHLYFPPIHHSTLLGCQVSNCQQPALVRLSFFLPRKHFILWKPLMFCDFYRSLPELAVVQTSSDSFFWATSNSFSFLHLFFFSPATSSSLAVSITHLLSQQCLPCSMVRLQCTSTQYS